MLTRVTSGPANSKLGSTLTPPLLRTIVSPPRMNYPQFHRSLEDKVHLLIQKRTLFPTFETGNSHTIDPTRSSVIVFKGCYSGITCNVHSVHTGSCLWTGSVHVTGQLVLGHVHSQDVGLRCDVTRGRAHGQQGSGRPPQPASGPENRFWVGPA